MFKRFQFWQFSPAGNTTLFLADTPQLTNRIICCGKALQMLGAEQAAVAMPEQKKFVMAGGEFCVNASRAFGALLALLETDEYVSVSYEAHAGDIPIRLTVTGQIPLWQVRVAFNIASLDISSSVPDETIVRLPGITHLLIRAEIFPAQRMAAQLAAELLARNNLLNEPASGIIWWRKIYNQFEILPYVTVKNAGTAMIESSCGSGSLALCAYLKTNCEVLQPSGSSLKVSIQKNCASIAGPVLLVANGQLWLNDSDCH